MTGWHGRIVRIDLTTATATVEDLDRRVAEQYIGGLGLGTKYLYDEVDPAVDALDAANKLYFATGPLTGTGRPGRQPLHAGDQVPAHRWHRQLQRCR